MLLSPVLLQSCSKDGPQDTAYYHVGDFYPDKNVVYNNGTLISGVAAEGVVFWVDPADATGRSGKALSLEYFQGKWAADGASTVQTSLTDEGDGAVNIQTLQAFIAGSDYLWSDFPIFNWVYNDLNGGAASPWYIPAHTEATGLHTSYSRYKTLINSKLSSVLGITLPPFDDGSVWSSTEWSYDSAYTWSGATPDKNNTCYAIAIRKF